MKYGFPNKSLCKLFRFKGAEYFLNKLERLKTGQSSFQFIVSRVLPNGKSLFDTNIKVSLEDYEIKEEADDGFDVVGWGKAEAVQNKD